MNKKICLLWVSILFWLSLIWFTTNAQNTQGQIALEIKAWFLTIAWSWTVSIGSISSNPSNEERIIPIENILQMRDISWRCGEHYTTMQIGNLSNGSAEIAKENISVNLQPITTLLGKENPSLSLGPTINNQRWLTTNPTTYIHRSIGTNCGTIGQYAATWDIKINIPANQSAGTYRGKIYFLLIDNN